MNAPVVAVDGASGESEQEGRRAVRPKVDVEDGGFAVQRTRLADLTSVAGSRRVNRKAAPDESSEGEQVRRIVAQLPWLKEAIEGPSTLGPAMAAMRELSSPGVLASATSRDFGLHGLQFEANEARFGTSEAQVQDAVDLGATVLRAPGVLELTWGALMTESAPVPVGRTAVIAALDNRLLAALIAERLRVPAAAGRAVILRCPLGDQRMANPANFILDPSTGQVLVSEPLVLDWRYHAAADVDPSYRGVLDIRSEYQVDHLGYMMEGIAGLLGKVATELAGEFDLLDVINAIEIFPNVDDRNVIPHPVEIEAADAARNGLAWASVWWHLANTLRDSLAALAEPLAIPLMLPAISHYFEEELDTGTVSRNSLIYRLEFLDALLAGVGLLTSLFGGTSLSDMVVAINYRWYRRDVASIGERARRLGPAHLGHLKREIRMVRDVLQGSNLAGVKVLTLDTGHSVTDNDEYVPTWMTGRTRLQAYEVWRRVAGALACGADVSGWQAWMSERSESESALEGNEDYGMGLRDDEVPLAFYAEQPPEPRLAWFAYQRLVRSLRNLRYARLLYPVVSGTAEPSFSGAEYLIICRFATRVTDAPSGSGETGSFAYLLLPDLRSKETYGWEVTVDWRRSPPAADAVCVRRATIPASFTVSAGTTTVLPEGSATWDPEETLALPIALPIEPGDDPVLLVCNYALTFAILYTPRARTRSRSRSRRPVPDVVFLGVRPRC